MKKKCKKAAIKQTFKYIGLHIYYHLTSSLDWNKATYCNNKSTRRK